MYIFIFIFIFNFYFHFYFQFSFLFFVYNFLDFFHIYIVVAITNYFIFHRQLMFVSMPSLHKHIDCTRFKRYTVSLICRLCFTSIMPSLMWSLQYSPLVSPGRLKFGLDMQPSCIHRFQNECITL